MAEPQPFNKTITTQASFDIAEVPGDRQGATVLVDGTFNGSTATLGYRNAAGAVINFDSTDAAITANGQISVVTGNSIRLVLTTTVANPTGINVLTSFW